MKTNLLLRLPILFIMIFMNVFISFSVGAVVMLQMLLHTKNQTLCLSVSLAAALITYVYILFASKLRDYIKK